MWPAFRYTPSFRVNHIFNSVIFRRTPHSIPLTTKFSTGRHHQFQHNNNNHTIKMSSSVDPYDRALSRLSSLLSNSTITSLFSSPPDPSVDLNSLAIPEMLAWLSRAGLSPEVLADSGLKCVHVAGTKGKGSVSAYISSILQQYSSSLGPVGLYTSPHLVSVRERISLNGEQVTRELFTRHVDETWDELTLSAKKLDKGLTEDECAGPGTKPFYFRFLTLVAMRMFLGEKVKSAVVECGIGGEYDSTNAVLGGAGSTSCSVVTQLGIDHVGMLGNTVEKIAWHKAGIFKRGVKGFTLGGGKEEGVMEVLRRRAEEKGAELVVVDEKEAEEWEGVRGAKLEGPFQKGNMALAVHAAREHLRGMGVRFDGVFGRDGEWRLSEIPEEFKRGLREAKLRGRCEVLRDREQKEVEWCVDGAHTEDSLAGVGEWFVGRTEREGKDGLRVLVFNQQDRDPEILVKALLSGAKKGVAGEGRAFTHAIFTRNEENQEKEGEDRDLSVQKKAEETMKAFNGQTQTSVQSSVRSAVERVRALAAQAKDDGMPCKVLATGSFHLIGAVLKIIDDVEY